MDKPQKINVRSCGSLAHSACMTPPSPHPVPLWLRIAYTVFMAVLIPVYWYHYGPTNFLYFCDIALLLTLAGMWMRSPLLISMCAVGILLPQFLWCVDFLVVLCGGRFTGMTDYMFRDTSLFLRGLSLFHAWLPFLLVYLIRRTGYDRRGFPLWTVLAWVLCLVSWFLLPPPADVPGDLTPRNVNFVYGFDETKAQTFLPGGWFLVVYMALLAVAVYWPTHLLLRRFAPAAPARLQSHSTAP